MSREIKRTIAKARMREAGFTKMFKKTTVKGQKGESVFARQWRKFVTRKPTAKPLNGFGHSKKKGEYWTRDPETGFHPLSQKRIKASQGRLYMEQQARAV